MGNWNEERLAPEQPFRDKTAQFTVLIFENYFIKD